MTVAISKAVEEGATAVICASTGNTSASAAAYAVRAGLTCVVLVPHGKIAPGKLAQALVHGARLLQVEGNFDDCLRLARDLADQLPGLAGQLGQPVPHRGPEDRRVRDRRRARRRARHALPAGRQRGQHHRVLEGLHASTPTTGCCERPRMWGFQAAGAAPIVRGERVAAPGDDRDRDPDRQPGVLGRRRGRARRVRRPHQAVTDRADPGRAPAAVGAGGRLRRAGERRVGGRAAAVPRAAACSTPASWSSAPSPATGSRTPRPPCARSPSTPTPCRPTSTPPPPCSACSRA